MSRNKKLILEIAIVGVMAALAIVLEKFSFPKGNSYLKFTFYGLPLIIVGCMYGVKVGFLTGLVSSFVMQLTSEYGLSITTPVWMLAPIAWGTVSGFAYYLFKKKNTLFYMLMVSLITSISATVLNTIAMLVDGLAYGGDFITSLSNILANLPPRLVSMIILSVAYALIMVILLNRLKFLMHEDNVEKNEE